MSTLASAERGQRERLAAELCAGRDVVLVEVRGGDAYPALEEAAASVTRVPPTRLVTAEVAPRGAIVCLDRLDRPQTRTLLPLIAAHIAESDAAALLACAPSTAYQELPDALVMRQHVVELCVLNAAEGGPTAVLDTPPLPPDGARTLVLLSGFAPDAVSVATRGTVRSANPVHATMLAALETANADLRRANARLARNANTRESAPSAALLARIDDARAARERAEEGAARLEERLALEVEVALQNDANYQHARAELASPLYVTVRRVRGKLISLPVIGRILRMAWRAMGD